MKKAKIYDAQGRRYILFSISMLKQDMQNDQARVYGPDGMRIRDVQEALRILGLLKRKKISE